MTAAFQLWPKQVEAMDLIWNQGVEQLLYGGAAGGAKSHFLRVLAYDLAMKWPGCRIPIFRLTFPELAETHLEPRSERQAFDQGHDRWRN